MVRTYSPIVLRERGMAASEVRSSSVVIAPLERQPRHEDHEVRDVRGDDRPALGRHELQQFAVGRPEQSTAVVDADGVVVELAQLRGDQRGVELVQA